MLIDTHCHFNHARFSDDLAACLQRAQESEVQQMIVDVGGQRSLHPDVKEPAGRTPLSQIKLLPDDPAGMLPQVAEIKKKYTAIFGN